MMLLSEKIEPKPLFLTLERVWFNKILSGEKTTEYREDKPFYQSRLIRRGEYRNYKAVTFQEGYNKNARRMTVKIKGIRLIEGVFEIYLGEILDKNFR